MSIFRFKVSHEQRILQVAAAVAGSAVVGAAASSAASSKAANAQSNAVNSANALSNAQYQQNRADQMPFLLNGTGANNQLAYLLGLSTTPGTAQPNLANSYLIDSMGNKNDYLYQNNEAYRKAWDAIAQQHYSLYGKNIQPGSNLSLVDQGLRAILQPDIAKDQAALQSQQASASNDPAYGSLNRKFSQDDLNNDVVYNTGLQFGLDQGTQGINRQAAASGNMLSGATLKALTRFGNDYGNTKANDAYNRYVNDQNNTYNRLAGLSSTGQVATQQVGASGQNAANNIGNNLTSLGNARGASAIAQGNSINNALSQGFNAYQNQQLLNGLSSGSDNWYNNVYKAGA